MRWLRCKANLMRGIDIHLPQALRVLEQRPQVHIRVLMTGCPYHALRAGQSWEPDLWMRFLQGSYPGVHGPVMVILPLIPEGARGGPTLEDQVMGLLEPFPVLSRIDAPLDALDGRATHKARDDSSTRIAVQHRDLFGHPDGVVNGNDVPQDRDLRFPGDLGDDSRIQIHRWLHTPVGGMVLIRHDTIESDLIGPGVLLMVLVVEHMGLVGVEKGVREAEAARLIL